MWETYLPTAWFNVSIFHETRRVFNWMRKKKTNVVPVHKKNDKKIFKSYQTASLLPICRTMFEPLMYNRLYEYFIENGLISSSQFGFEPGNSCINQSLCITHDIYQPFGNGFEFRGVFLVNYLPMTRAFFSNIW